MSTRHLAFWPNSQPQHLTVPQTSLSYNVEVSATRFPDKPFIIFYDTPISFAEFKDEVERIAGFLEQECGIGKGDRVLIVDDLLATGGTAAAVGRMVQEAGGVVVGMGFVVELTFLGGRGRLSGHDVFSLLEYDK